LSFHSATQEASLIDALEYIQSDQHTRRDYLPAIISLDFASVRWQALVKSRQKMKTVLDRRQLEVCVFHYLALDLLSGDVYVEGSEAHADPCGQLLPWLVCLRRLPAYCQALQIPDAAKGFVAHLQQRLREVTERVDTSFPDNTELSIDDSGTPHLKRLKAQLSPPQKTWKRFKPCSKSVCPSGICSMCLKMCTMQFHIPGILVRLPAPIQNCPMISHAIFLPYSVMLLNSALPKPLAIPKTSLVGIP
jgi:hypothetical protein